MTNRTINNILINNFFAVLSNSMIKNPITIITSKNTLSHVFGAHIAMRFDIFGDGDDPVANAHNLTIKIINPRTTRAIADTKKVPTDGSSNIARKKLAVTVIKQLLNNG